MTLYVWKVVDELSEGGDCVGGCVEMWYPLCCVICGRSATGDLRGRGTTGCLRGRRVDLLLPVVSHRGASAMLHGSLLEDVDKGVLLVDLRCSARLLIGLQVDGTGLSQHGS